MRNVFQAEEDAQVVHHFGLEIQGLMEATFREASGFENTSEIIESRETKSDGKQFIRKMPGNVKWADLSLKRGMTMSKDLWDWRQQVLDGDISGARKDGTVVFYDAQDTPIARFDFFQGWPSKWKGADVNTTNNSVAVEEISICHEGLVRSQ